MVWVSIQGSSTPARLAMYWPRLKSVRYTLLFLATTRPGRGFALNKCEAIGAHAEPFEIGSRTLQVDLIAIAADMGDLQNGRGARDCDLVADLGHGRFRGSGFLAGLRHCSASVTLRLVAWPPLTGVRPSKAEVQTMRRTWVLLTAILLSASPAVADSIQLLVNSSVLAKFSSPNDNFWGTYSTGEPYTDHPSLGSVLVFADFPSVSVFVPTGNAVTSAIINVILPQNPIQGTGVNFTLTSFQPPNSGISIAPTFNGTGSTNVFVSSQGSSFFPLPAPIISGNQVSTGDLDLNFLLNGVIQDTVASSGVNWAGYIGGSGQVLIPYTVELDVTYAPVPEPSTFVLIGAGIFAIAGWHVKQHFSVSATSV